MNQMENRIYNFSYISSKIYKSEPIVVPEHHRIIEAPSLYAAIFELMKKLAKEDISGFTIQNITVGKCEFPVDLSKCTKQIDHLYELWNKQYFRDLTIPDIVDSDLRKMWNLNQSDQLGS